MPNRRPQLVTIGHRRPQLIHGIVAAIVVTLLGCQSGDRPPGANAAGPAGFDRAPAVVETVALSLSAMGVACAANAECDSNFCVDGVCCNTACAGGTNDCNACSVAAGAAVNGVCGARTCTALDQCHDPGVCDPTTGCNDPVKVNGTVCNDTNACTSGETCQSGACTPAAVVTCAAPDQCHDVATCNTTTGVCDYPAKANGTSCNDSDACTLTDTCQAGACTGANPKVCAALSQCHTAGTCNPATGDCTNPAKADGTVCNDSSICTSSDVCASGTCSGTAVNCNDGNGCTADSCIPATGCLNLTIPLCPAPIDAAPVADAADAAPVVDAVPDLAASDLAPDSPPDVAPVDMAPVDMTAVDTAPKPDLMADTTVVDVAPVADVMVTVDTSPPADATTTVPDTSPPPVIEIVDAGRDVGTADVVPPIAVGGGGGCDCDVGKRGGGTGTPAKTALLLGVGLFWLARRRRG